MQDLKAIRFIPGTKVSHDYSEEEVRTFSYRDLINRNLPAIGIPCRQNNLFVVDVDVAGQTHKKDGRAFWFSFAQKNDLGPTYVVGTPSGGYHFYYKLPDHINPITFAPPKELAQGVDLKWNGWVGAPPTPGYTILAGGIETMAEAPQALLDFISDKVKNRPVRNGVEGDLMPVIHRPFSQEQLRQLNEKLDWFQRNGELSYSEWRDGLFALKAGIDDPALLDEMVQKWTYNTSYSPGDEYKAREIVDRADKNGPIGPGTILQILSNVQRRMNAPVDVVSPFTGNEMIEKANIGAKMTKEGIYVCKGTDSNASALMGVMFDETMLYYDTRMDQYIFKGEAITDVELINIFIPMIQSPATGLGLVDFKRSNIAAGLDVLMQMRRRDPHLESLKSLVWDKVPRIETFFSTFAGAEDTPYTRRVGKCFWASLAARGLKPGVKCDSMIVLEGKQGLMKSTFVSAIAGKYAYSPSDKDAMNNLDILRQMHQSVIVELPELMGFINQPAEKVKAFLSQDHDVIRPLFAKRAVRKARGFVFVGTTNRYDYLSKELGARRFWPIKISEDVGGIDISGIKLWRDQLYAEGIELYRQGFDFWHVPDELLLPEIDKRIHRDPLETPVKEIIARCGSISVVEVYRQLVASDFINKGLTSSLMSRLEVCVDRAISDLKASGWGVEKTKVEVPMEFNNFV